MSLVGVLNKLCDGADGGGVQTLDFKRRPVSSVSFSLSSLTPFSFLGQLFSLVYLMYKCVYAAGVVQAELVLTHGLKVV